MDTEHLRHLIDNDYQADARLESGQHRLGYEVRDETTPQHGRNEQNEADHCGEGGGGGNLFCVCRRGVELRR